tara:strand:+ start:55037 stop:55897 length:861 start_codon:yes stop_codon:yes gene_type:complete
MSYLKSFLKLFNERENSKSLDPFWHKCTSCKAFNSDIEYIRNQHVCYTCGFHNYISARKWIENFLDIEELEEIYLDLEVKDHLNFYDTMPYSQRLEEAKQNTDESEALIVFYGKLYGMPVVAGAFEFKFIAGSMGQIVGERFVNAVNCAIHNHCPLVCFVTSGGARMQESLFSLVQMARVSAVLVKLSENKLPFIPILANPCTGGVSASLASLGDIIIAEPKALIGFAGPRVIKQTTGVDLPEGFQTSEFLLEKGSVDMIVSRKKTRQVVHRLLTSLMYSHSMNTL